MLFISIFVDVNVDILLLIIAFNLFRAFSASVSCLVSYLFEAKSLHFPIISSIRAKSFLFASKEEIPVLSVS